MEQETQQNADQGETLCGTHKVLIFDEDVEDLARNAEPFEAHGFEVHKCTTVESAMRSVEREEFDFALVDQGSSSFEGLRIIRHLVRLQLKYAFCRDGAPQGPALLSARPRPWRDGLFGEPCPWSRNGAAYQELFLKLINEIN